MEICLLLVNSIPSFDLFPDKDLNTCVIIMKNDGWGHGGVQRAGV